MNLKTEEVYTRMAEMVLARYSQNARKSLLDVYQNDPAFTKLSPETIEYAFTNRDEILKILDDPILFNNLVDLFVEASMHFTYQNNQFIHLDQSEHVVLKKIYHDYLLDYKNVLTTCISPDALENGLSHWIRQHFKDLSTNISRFFDDELTQNQYENIILKQTVCSEYTPELQIDLLGIQTADLIEPVLDLGCGFSGSLVTHLRSLGIRATGFDRQVRPCDYLLAADWFEMNFKKEQWGSIISHMAFSNHFLFHHYYKNGQPEKYARFYMHLLAALKPGGTFYYTPGLPFIERFLPADLYHVTCHPFSQSTLKLPQIQLLHELEEKIWYAARVTKTEK